MDDNVEIEICLRFVGISKSQYDHIEALCNEFEIECRKINSNYVVAVKLEIQKSFDKIIELFDRCNFEKDQYGLFISIVTESDSEILEIPPAYVDLSRKIGGKIEFSFTCVFP